MKLRHLPDEFQKSIQAAVTILKEAGCKEIFLFGSMLKNHIRHNSDIDIAVRGCPKGKYFHTIGKLMIELDYQVDLIDLDNNDPFSRFLENEGEMIRIV